MIHDNETLVQWYKGLDKESKAFAEEYINSRTPAKEKYWDFIRLAMMSVANTCITPIQDFMGLGVEARMNQPSTLGMNWKWRMKPEMISSELNSKIYALTKLSDRLSDGMKEVEAEKLKERILAEKAEKAEKAAKAKKA